jgi:hypothetical protein
MVFERYLYAFQSFTVTPSLTPSQSPSVGRLREYRAAVEKQAATLDNLFRLFSRQPLKVVLWPEYHRRISRQEDRSMEKYSGPGERRRQQNRIAQRRYRESGFRLHSVDRQKSYKFFQGDKIAEQTRRLEEFAHQARRLLTEAVDLEVSKPRCPECSHCREVASDSEYTGPQISSQTPGRHQQDEAEHGLGNPPMDLRPSPASKPSQGNEQRPEFESTPDRHSPIPSSIQHKASQGNSTASVAAATSIAAGNRCGDHTTFVALPTPLPDHNFIGFQNPTADFLGNYNFMATPCASEEPARHAPPQQDVAAIHFAAKKGQTAILSILIRTGFYVDSQDESGRTPLHQCAIHGHIEAAKVLLEANADTNAVDAEGASVILTAVKANQQDMVELLLNYKR